LPYTNLPVPVPASRVPAYQSIQALNKLVDSIPGPKTLPAIAVEGCTADQSAALVSVLVNAPVLEVFYNPADAARHSDEAAPAAAAVVDEPTSGPDPIAALQSRDPRVRRMALRTLPMEPVPPSSEEVLEKPTIRSPDSDFEPEIIFERTVRSIRYVPPPPLPSALLHKPKREELFIVHSLREDGYDVHGAPLFPVPVEPSADVKPEGVILPTPRANIPGMLGARKRGRGNADHHPVSSPASSRPRSAPRVGLGFYAERFSPVPGEGIPTEADHVRVHRGVGADHRVYSLPQSLARIEYTMSSMQPVNYVQCAIPSCKIKASHWLGICPIFMILSMHQKWVIISIFQLCAICLTSDHGFDRELCPYRAHSCGLLCKNECERLHASMLCPEPILLPPLSCVPFNLFCDCSKNFFGSLPWWQCIWPACSDITVHEAHLCLVFRAMTVFKRWEMIRKYLICPLCFKQGHSRFFCKEVFPAILFRCPKNCFLDHHVMLHPEPIVLSEYADNSVPCYMPLFAEVLCEKDNVPVLGFYEPNDLCEAPAVFVPGVPLPEVGLVGSLAEHSHEWHEWISTDKLNKNDRVINDPLNDQDFDKCDDLGNKVGNFAYDLKNDDCIQPNTFLSERDVEFIVSLIQDQGGRGVHCAGCVHGAGSESQRDRVTRSPPSPAASDDSSKGFVNGWLDDPTAPQYIRPNSPCYSPTDPVYDPDDTKDEKPAPVKVVADPVQVIQLPDPDAPLMAGPGRSVPDTPDPFKDTPSFMYHHSILQRTLFIRKLRSFIDMAFPRRYLEERLAYPFELFRESISIVCGRREVIVNFNLDKTFTVPVVLERGLNIFTFAPSNLSLNQDSVGTYATLGQAREGTGLTISFAGDVRFRDLYNGKVMNLGGDRYIMGDKPENVLVVWPFGIQEEDKRFYSILRELKRDRWPIPANVTTYDMFVRRRMVHKLDYKSHIVCPVISRTHPNS